MKQHVSIGVLGCASIAERSVIPAIKSLEGVYLNSVASRSEQKATRFAEKFDTEALFGYDELINRPEVDMLYIPLPTGMHEEWVMKALNSGKHLLVEKSLSLDYDSTKQMVELARKKGLLLMENFMFKYHSQHKFVFDMLNSGELGDFRCLRGAFGFPPLENSNFRYNKALGGGALLDAGAYMASLSHLYLGDSIEVTASVMNFNEGYDVDIYGSACLTNNQKMTSQVSWGFDNSYQCNYELWGSKAKVTLMKALTPKPDEKPKVIIQNSSGTKEIELPCDNHFVNILNTAVTSIHELKFERHYKDCLIQSRLLEEIRNKSI